MGFSSASQISDLDQVYGQDLQKAVIEDLRKSGKRQVRKELVFG
jgi:hypothetical protein